MSKNQPKRNARGIKKIIQPEAGNRQIFGICTSQATQTLVILQLCTYLYIPNIYVCMYISISGFYWNFFAAAKKVWNLRMKKTWEKYKTHLTAKKEQLALAPLLFMSDWQTDCQI